MRAALARRLLDLLSVKARAAHQDEEGGSMVFGAITLFTLALFTLLVYQIGMNSGDRISLQGAADSAAYSAALVEAESLESVAFLNDGMAFVYYACMRYAVDAIVYSTLRAFWYHDLLVDPSISPSFKQFMDQEAGKPENDPDDTKRGVRIQPNQPDRLRVLGEGPWMILEDDSWVKANNPGARDGMNYQPGTDPNNPGQVQINRNPRDYDWVAMGDSGKVFDARYKQAAQNAARNLPRGKAWIADLHWAERIIVAATPQLVAKTAVVVGIQNGAQMVAVSDDVDQVFRIAQSTAATDLAGFTDGRESTSKEVDGDMARRYSLIENPVDRKKVGLPSWFRKETGEAGTGPKGYAQIRLCWNRRDWDHSPETPGKYDQHNGYPGLSEPPNGHWHSLHAHNVDYIDPQTGEKQELGPILGSAYDHDFGHGIQSGDDADMHDILFQPSDRISDYMGMLMLSDKEINASGGDHHAAQRCPTCFASMSGPGYPQVGYTQVYHTLTDGEAIMKFELGGATGFNKVKFTGSDDTFPRPLRLKGRLFRAGITVACWSPTRGLGRVLPGSPFGMLAIASAQIGVRNRNGVLMIADQVSDASVTLSSHGSAPVTRTVVLSSAGGGSLNSASDNFYLGDGDGDSGLRFGARLVPIARELTWTTRGGAGSSSTNAANDGLGALVNGPRWWSGPSDWSQQLGPPAGSPPQALTYNNAFKNVLDVTRTAKSFPH